MLLSEIVEASARVAGSSSRLAKIRHLADCLRLAGAEEIAIAVAFLSGELTQRQIGVGRAALRDQPPPGESPSLTVVEVNGVFARVGAASGPGSQAVRRELLQELFGRATAPEQEFLIRLISGELRQGALDGVMTDAIARAADVPLGDVRRAAMLRGSLGPVAAAALDGGVDALSGFGLEVGRPVRPMLAESAASVDAALDRLSREGSPAPVAVEWKLDGIRVQVHRLGDEVRIFTRTLDDISARVPEIVEAAHELPAGDIVLDGEAIALHPDGRPRAFQDTASRTGSRRDVDRLRAELPLSTYFFDLLHIDGADLLDEPAAERHAALAKVVDETQRIPRLVTADRDVAAAFFADAVARGHEGVVMKALETPYTAGRRGAGWIKVKPRHTVDLVVLAAEWGHGRRRGWLSNLHLGARDARTGEFVMLGKTFKGLTDELLTRQTEQFLAIATEQDDWVVRVRPELVVEIAYDGVQRSSRYPGGVALRFARVLRYRPDKTAAEADTVDTVVQLGGGSIRDAEPTAPK